LVPGGRLAISDMVAVGELSDAVLADPAAYVGCVAGAARPSELERLLTESGFVDLRIQISSPAGGEAVASALVEATKPEASTCCGPSRQATCCAPSEKAGCCGSTATTGTCGCQGA